MKVIKTVQWLKKQHMNEGNLVIVDVRFNLGNPLEGKQQYLMDHIPGAVFLDMGKDLSAPATKHGGRHPLPDTQQISQKLGDLGIDQETSVLIYDDQGGLFASRLWWQLQYLGHERTYILDGGYSKWKDAGYELTADICSIKRTTFTANVQNQLLASMEDVKKNEGRLIDSREKTRYLGEMEPIDKKAGHIPGAVNYFWKGVLTETGEWKDEEELRKHFEALSKDEEIIVYCGSGVSACPNVLTLKEMGYSNVKLYSGSWSDWISYEENDIAIGEE